MKTRRSLESATTGDGQGPSQPQPLNPHTLEGKSVDALRVACEERGLSTGGSKQSLIDRLRGYEDDRKWGVNETPTPRRRGDGTARQPQSTTDEVVDVKEFQRSIIARIQQCVPDEFLNPFARSPVNSTQPPVVEPETDSKRDHVSKLHEQDLTLIQVDIASAETDTSSAPSSSQKTQFAFEEVEGEIVIEMKACSSSSPAVDVKVSAHTSARVENEASTFPLMTGSSSGGSDHKRSQRARALHTIIADMSDKRREKKITNERRSPQKPHVQKLIDRAIKQDSREKQQGNREKLKTLLTNLDSAASNRQSLTNSILDRPKTVIPNAASAVASTTAIGVKRRPTELPKITLKKARPAAVQSTSSILDELIPEEVAERVDTCIVANDSLPTKSILAKTPSIAVASSKTVSFAAALHQLQQSAERPPSPIPVLDTAAILQEQATKIEKWRHRPSTAKSVKFADEPIVRGGTERPPPSRSPPPKHVVEVAVSPPPPPPPKNKPIDKMPTMEHASAVAVQQTVLQSIVAKFAESPTKKRSMLDTVQPVAAVPLRLPDSDIIMPAVVGERVDHHRPPSRASSTSSSNASMKSAAEKEAVKLLREAARDINDSDESEGEVLTDSEFDDVTDDEDEEDSDSETGNDADPARPKKKERSKMKRVDMMDVLKRAGELLQVNEDNNVHDDDTSPKTSTALMDPLASTLTNEHLNAAQSLLRELQGGEPLIQQAVLTQQQMDEIAEQYKQRPPPLPAVPTGLIERMLQRRLRRQKLAERGLGASGAAGERGMRPEDEFDDDDIDDDDENSFVDIDANYEQDIAKLIAAALRKSRQLEDGQPDSDEESVIIEADPDDLIAADVADLCEALIDAVESGCASIANTTLVKQEPVDDADEHRVTSTYERAIDDNIILLTQQPLAVETESTGLSAPPRPLRRTGEDDDDDEEDDDLYIMPHLPDDQVQLDFYHSDLHMKSIASNRYAAEPDTKDGLVTMWCGMRATYGMSWGRVAFECRVLHKLPSVTVAMNVTDDMPDRWGFRAGWSLGSVQCAYGYVLGDTHNSWAYSINAGLKGTSSKFVEYGRPAQPGDVITCLLDLHQRYMEFLVNGETCGIAYVDLDTASAFKPEPSEGDDDDEVEPPDPCVYYPHVCAKNVRFECNFGQQKSDEHWEPLPAGFTYINDFALGDRVRAMKPPPLKQNCTVLMMCGMPGAGKTRWVHEYISEHPDEQWTVISTDAALEHMKLNGVGRHATDALRWDHIMGLAWKATYRWLILAPRRRRNYIIDGTNVAVNTRRRKLLPFKDFNKKCVVLMPDESTEIRRRARQEEMTGMPMPFDALTELKGLFCVPDERSDPLFAQIFYEELPESDNLQSAYNLAKKYNKEGKIWYLARYGYRYGHPAEATRIAQLAQQEREQDKYRSFPEKRVVGPIEQSRINLMGAAPTFAQNKRARLSAGDDTAPLSAAGSNDDRSQPLYTSHMMPSPAADVAATVGTPVFGAITEFAGELLTVTPIPTEPSTASTGQHDDIWPSTATGFFGTRVKADPASQLLETVLNPPPPPVDGDDETKARSASGGGAQPELIDLEDEPTTKTLWARQKLKHRRSSGAPPPKSE